jgi:hypothetical protein
MSIGLGFLFWLVVIIAAILAVVEYRARPSYGYAVLIILTIILGLAVFGGVHVH